MIEREIKLIQKAVKLRFDENEDEIVKKAIDFVSLLIEDIKKTKQPRDDTQLLFEALFELAKERILLDEELDNLVEELNPETGSSLDEKNT